MTPRINTADYVRPITAARRIGISVQRVKQLLDDGRLPHVEIDGVRHVHTRDVERARDERLPKERRP